MFKVVPDQLRISEGWVRCGQCEEIFDASAHMQPSAGEGGEVEVTDEPQGASAAAIDVLARPTASESNAIVDFELQVPGIDEPALVEPVLDDSTLLPDGSAYGIRAPEPLVADPAPAMAAHAVASEPANSTPAPPVPATAAELSFMRSAKKASRWHQPLVRATLLVSCLLLMLGLVLQVLVQERDRIVAVEPALKPLLEEVCLQLHCRISPLRQIESVVIDSSAFSKIRADAYRLSLTLKNTAPVDLAMPAVELALTDTLDNALVRRVFQPDELGVKTGVIRAVSETQTTLVLTVKANGNGDRVAGYRLLAFYP